MVAKSNGVILDEIERSRSTPPIETVVSDLSPGTSMASRTQDKTVVPNWVFPILATALFGLLGFVYWTVEKEIDRLRQDMSTQQILVQHTREQLIAHGWTIDPNTGDIRAPEAQPTPHRGR